MEYSDAIYVKRTENVPEVPQMILNGLNGHNIKSIFMPIHIQIDEGMFFYMLSMSQHS